jgi:hypothetical protein
MTKEQTPSTNSEISDERLAELLQGGTALALTMPDFISIITELLSRRSANSAGRVEVKALSWFKDAAYNLTATCAVGTYHIERPSEASGDPIRLYFRQDPLGSFATADEAKDAAQADFNQRILSSLHPTEGAEPVAWWDVQEFKVWKGIDPEKPVWHSRGFCCRTWADANDLLEYLQHNSPETLLRVTLSPHSASPSTRSATPVSAEVTECLDLLKEALRLAEYGHAERVISDLETILAGGTV